MPQAAGCECLREYSDEFQHLITSRGISSLLQDSYFESSFTAWESARKPIADFIDREGSVLDVGCANGFLLRSIQEWAKVKIVPYGIDSNTRLVEEAKALFPNQPEHFEAVDITEKPKLPQTLPDSFDFVYWNVWDDTDFRTPESLMTLSSVLDLVKEDGEVILGFYHEDNVANQEKIKQIQNLGISFEQVVEIPQSSVVIGSLGKISKATIGAIRQLARMQRK